MNVVADVFDGIALIVGILCIAFCIVLLATYLVDAIKFRTELRFQAARGWQEGYDQGVNDERQAAEWNVPEYRIPKRQNPYGNIATNKGDRHGHGPLQASR